MMKKLQELKYYPIKFYHNDHDSFEVQHPEQIKPFLVEIFTTFWFVDSVELKTNEPIWLPYTTYQRVKNHVIVQKIDEAL